MSEHVEPLDAQRVLGLFHELSDHLAADGVQAQLFVVGGAAMALAYDQGRLTRDVDALFVPAPAVRAAAEQISAAHGLEPDWLNDAAKGFLPGSDEHPRTVFESESLLVQVPSPQYLLAMKLHASRDERDLDDAATLFILLGYTSAQQAIDLIARTYPPAQLLPRHRYVAEDVARRAAEQDTSRADAPPAASAPPGEVPRPAQGPRPSRRRPRSPQRFSNPEIPPHHDRPSGPPAPSL